MSENSSTPEESEATGRVTTDGSAPSAGSPAQAPSPATASEVNGAAAGNGAASKGNSNGAATPAEPASDGAGKAAASDETQVDETKADAGAAAPAEPAGSMSGAGLFKPAAPGPSAGPATPAAPSGETADPPTVVTSEPARQPAPPRGSGGGPANGAAPRPPVPGPRPAPGPVPGPGPEAAPPPPWQRVPGHEQRDPRDAPGRAATVGDLLGDGPTVVMGPQGGGQPGEQPRTSAPGSATGGWQAVRATRNRTPRQAALQLKRLDPWSVLKLSLVLAVVLFFIWLVAVGVLYGVLDGMGVWDQLNGNYANLVTENAPAGGQLINAGRVFGFAAVVGAINSLLFAVAMTISAFVYNVSADLVGGVEVTLSERD